MQQSQGQGARASLARAREGVRLAWSATSSNRGLARRVRRLEADLAAVRPTSRRLALLTDVVQELLLPVDQRDDALVRARIAAFRTTGRTSGGR